MEKPSLTAHEVSDFCILLIKYYKPDFFIEPKEFQNSVDIAVEKEIIAISNAIDTNPLFLIIDRECLIEIVKNVYYNFTKESISDGDITFGFDGIINSVIKQNEVTDNTIKFFGADKYVPIVEFKNDGNILVNGKLTENDLELTNGFRDFLKVYTDSRTISHGELERLAVLSEEAAEVSQVINKIIRFGWDSYKPSDPDKKTNREHLATELGDLQYWINYLLDKEDIDQDIFEKAIADKRIKSKQYLRHQS